MKLKTKRIIIMILFLTMAALMIYWEKHIMLRILHFFVYSFMGWVIAFVVLKDKS